MMPWLKYRNDGISTGPRFLVDEEDSPNVRQRGREAGRAVEASDWKAFDKMARMAKMDQTYVQR
jgi:hypothetical protein